jgi:hypothetical protein
MFPALSIKDQLALFSVAIEKTLGAQVAAPEIKRLREIAYANPRLAHSFLTEAIRQWRATGAHGEAARIAALYSRKDLSNA